MTTPRPPRPGPRRHHRYRHEERAYRQAVRVRRACILLSIGLLLGTGLMVRHALESAAPPADATTPPRTTTGMARVAQPAR